MADSPARFGEYAVEECLHRGASAEVYRVTHEGLGGFRRSYAVKAIRADRVSEAGLVALFEEEARIGGKLSHANIVQVREPGRRGDTVYIVKELVAGATLAQLLETNRGGALGLQESLSLAIEVLKALEYAHTRKVRRGNRTVDLVVPHKDLSPRNILLSLQGEVKLTNFGVPASADARPSYTAPEVLRGEPATPHADLYSCGVVLYQMLTGLHPFPSPPGRRASREVDPRPLRSQQPALPTALIEVVERSLRPHPGQRLSSATAMKNALAAVLSDAGLVPAPHSLAALVESARSAQGATTGAGSASDEERTDGDLGPAPPLRPRPQPAAGDSPAARLLKSLGEAPVRPVSESDATEIRRIPPRAAPPVRSAPPVRAAPPMAPPEDWNNAPTRLRSEADLSSPSDLDLDLDLDLPVSEPPPAQAWPVQPAAAPAEPPPPLAVRPSPAVRQAAVAPVAARQPAAVRPTPPPAPPLAVPSPSQGARWLWVVSGGAVALLVMLVGFFLGARTAGLRAAQTRPITIAAPMGSNWQVAGEAVAPDPGPDGTSLLVVDANTSEVVAETPEGIRLRVRVGPDGDQHLALERLEPELNP